MANEDGVRVETVDLIELSEHDRAAMVRFLDEWSQRPGARLFYQVRNKVHGQYPHYTVTPEAAVLIVGFPQGAHQTAHPGTQPAATSTQSPRSKTNDPGVGGETPTEPETAESRSPDSYNPSAALLYHLVQTLLGVLSQSYLPSIAGSVAEEAGR